jgi:hypothetical protein
MTSQRPDIGPSGYLPPRAAKRARKIMLREPLGLQWAVAAMIAGVLVLVAGGILVTVFAAPDQPVSWCAESGHLESADGAVWEPSGRLIGGRGSSLARLPVEIHSGVVYVDPSADGERRTPQPERGATPACGS